MEFHYNSVHETHKRFDSSDSNVKKYVFEFRDDPFANYFREGGLVPVENKAIAEAVLYKYGPYKKRTVICCSVQSGCPVGCTFCGTGKFFVRNLGALEIVKQVDVIINEEVLNETDTKDIEKFQIMFMSMGEPMYNFNCTQEAIRLLHEKYPNAQLLISTSAPTKIYSELSSLIKLSLDIDKVGLQFSVHESTDVNRKKLIPSSTCTLQQISTIGELWAAAVGRKPFYNYCVHEGNNTIEDAKRLNKLFNPDVWECTLSVICEKDESVKSSIERQLNIINDFKVLMLEEGASLRVFNPAGQDDIGGGCGQLWYFQEWLKNNVKECK